MPAVGQGVGKLCPPSATARDPAFRSGHFQPIVPFLFGSHEWNITFANKLTCPAANFAKGSCFCLFVEILSPLGDLWRSPLEPPPTPSWPFAVLRGPSWKCFCLFALRGYPLPPSQPLANPSRSPTNALVALRGPSCPFVDNSFSLRALRGSPSWISFLEDASHRRALLARPKGLAYYFCRGRETQ